MCSRPERERLIEAEMAEGASRKEAEKIAEDLREYDDFFVPPKARWSSLLENSKKPASRRYA